MTAGSELKIINLFQRTFSKIDCMYGALFGGGVNKMSGCHPVLCHAPDNIGGRIIWGPIFHTVLNLFKIIEKISDICKMFTENFHFLLAMWKKRSIRYINIHLARIWVFYMCLAVPQNLDKYGINVS